MEKEDDGLGGWGGLHYAGNVIDFNETEPMVQVMGTVDTNHSKTGMATGKRR